MNIVCLNGRYLKENEAKISVGDAGFLYGEGIYETLRTVDGKLMNLEAHLERLGQSARIIGMNLKEIEKIGKWAQQVVKKNEFKSEARVRITVSGGVHGFGTPAEKPTILITAVPLASVGAQRARGVSVITFLIERPLPEAKTTFLVPAMLARQVLKKSRAYEAILVDRNGYVTEGSISNVFMVKKGIIYTPKSGILGGTTRARIIELARQHKWRLKVRDFKVRELFRADEVFICNAPRGIVPVRRIDGKIIGNGKMGEVTRRVWEGLKG
ncbi:hypothetical protein HN748_03520 [Candidatus Peregrinibacteria bacterium]|jgi:D-amino acid aminotransferase|nr:hypothetical protein [Candidatus Peregrinibacteria bacterium]MBT7483313.1 hypothetical protein [Candidatus Peregrinibacteria bacterium]MBT7703278.1 hypothetical protein [Candidatus Peregrinibacteria bacterium]